LAKLTGRGGAGRGQGKKKVAPQGAKSRHRVLTDEEAKAVDDLIKQMRTK
jgi:hypothetical protein